MSDFNWVLTALRTKRVVRLLARTLRRTARLTLRPPRRNLRATLRAPRRAVLRAPALRRTTRRTTFRLARRTLRFTVRLTRRAAERRRTLLPDFLFAMLNLRMLHTLNRASRVATPRPNARPALRRCQRDKSAERGSSTCIRPLPAVRGVASEH